VGAGVDFFTKSRCRSGAGTDIVFRSTESTEAEHWTDILFRQRSTNGSSKGQRISREVISQPVLVNQTAVRNFLKSLLQT